MNNYSIIRIGNEFVVRAGDAGILKVASRRQAVRLVAVAAELLNSPALLPAETVPSIAGDPQVTLDSRVALDPRVAADPEIMPDPDCRPGPLEVP